MKRVLLLLLLVGVVMSSAWGATPTTIYINLESIGADTMVAGQVEVCATLKSPLNVADTIAWVTADSTFLGKNPAKTCVRSKAATGHGRGIVEIDVIPTSAISPPGCRYEFVATQGGKELFRATLAVATTDKTGLMKLYLTQVE